MSEEINTTPLSEETTTVIESPPAQETTVAATPSPSAQGNVEKKSNARMFIAPAWFLFGILIGLGIFAVYAELTRPPTMIPVAQLDEAVVRQAAREGLVEAIRQLQNENGQASQGPQTVDPDAFAMQNAHVLGNQDAPISIVEFADFQCPFCGRYHTAVAPTIFQEYIQTGKAKLIYKHVAFLGPESVYAAVASECAANQDKFWEFHDYLFEHQQGENEGAFNKDKLLAFGQALNLDAAQFEKCVTNDETVARVQADTEEAQKFGVSSTPTFFVNGKPLVGLKSVDEFRQVLDAAVNQ